MLDLDPGLALPQVFFQRPAPVVARELLGSLLVAQVDGQTVAVRVQETEAYHQQERGCHCYGGRQTPRTAPMFQAGGLTYVYFVYGMHWALNFVTGQAGCGEAVLIRGAQVEVGGELVAARRGFAPAGQRPRPASARRWLDGPGKLCQGLGIERRHNQLRLDGSAGIWCQSFEVVGDSDVEVLPRVGIAYAGEDASLPWRWRSRA